MKRLLHFVGRAWSFVTSRIPGEHFVINKTTEVTDFLCKTEKDLKNMGEIQIQNFDIVGCFPNMPKDIIRVAMRSIREKFRQYEGVFVPRFSECQRCTWATKRKSMQLIPFKVMLDVLDFCLDNTFMKMHDGQINKQMEGIHQWETRCHLE